jgi:predicted XRE-type DNA-binding protein
MRENKKRRLEARGWRVGTVTEFLGLSAEEEEYIELKLRLADGFRRRRAQRQLTQGAAARLLRSSQSRVAKMEAGDASVSLDLLIRSLLALGTSRAELARMITNRRVARAA